MGRGRTAITSYERFTRHSEHKSSRDWMHKAACRSKNPTAANIQARANIFYPVPPKNKKANTIRRQLEQRAKQICDTCPVKAECKEYVDALEESLAKDDRYGIWGGMTEADRKAERLNGGTT